MLCSKSPRQLKRENSASKVVSSFTTYQSCIITVIQGEFNKNNYIKEITSYLGYSNREIQKRTKFSPRGSTHIFSCVCSMFPVITKYYSINTFQRD